MDIFGFYIHYALAVALLNKEITTSGAILYPQASETREVRSLDGLWNFVKSDVASEGEDNKWFSDDLSRVQKTIKMPVPASYNDITTEQELRDHMGKVWYDRKFFVPFSWKKKQRVCLRFGSVYKKAVVYINGALVVQNEVGYLPFEAEITSYLKFANENRITVMCDNSLQSAAASFGGKDAPYCLRTNYTSDSFNYAGIHGSVHLYTTPSTYMEDIEVTTTLTKDNTQGSVTYKIITPCKDPYVSEDLRVRVRLLNKEGKIVANDFSTANELGVLHVKNVNPWWPYLMHSEPAYLYQMEVFLLGTDNAIHDMYRLPVGIRALKWDDTSLLLNNRPLYFRGFGRREDSDIRGKGLDLPLMIRDFNLLKWIGANAYRTSHYPFSEESMQFADENGIMIIDEYPNLDTGNKVCKHISDIKQLVQRDLNHPSVVMWFIANEAQTDHMEAKLYIKNLVDDIKLLDPSRPITASIAVSAKDDMAAKSLDIISFSRYNGWYSNPGRLDQIPKNVMNEVARWYNMKKKPIIMSEYGADTAEGLHVLPSYVWSEEYQTELFSQHFKAFDILTINSWFVGEFVGNFADFKTPQSFTRVGGDRKGVFTRSRQPKAAAHLLRKRYFALCHKMSKCNLPADLITYIKNNSSLSSGKHDGTEL